MTDSERVVRRLERQIKNAHNESNDFAYIPIGTARLIISLLEKDKPVAPEFEGGGHTWFYVCGDCHGVIDDRDKYCRHCGRSVQWNDGILGAERGDRVQRGRRAGQRNGAAQARGGRAADGHAEES